jgi:hypothetical protein
MTKKRFIWRGPPTTIEIWDEAEGVAAWSGFVATGAEIAAELDEDSPQVENWAAFGLIEAAPVPQAPPVTEKPRSRREAAAHEENSDNG